MTATVKSYSMLQSPVSGSTGTGYDQIVDVINIDPGLAGANKGRDVAGGASAANGMNEIIVEAIDSLGAFNDGSITKDEVVAINSYIRANYLDQWTLLHGDDENSVETGFHLVQSDGATTKYRGANLVDTVADGIYHLGFEIQNGAFLNEDGAANATVDQMAGWLTQFYIDHSTTGTGMDRIANLVMADPGLAAKIPEADIGNGADSANGISQIIVDAIEALDLGADGRISPDDVVAISNFIRNDPELLAQFVLLHGDDEGGEETGFHTVQNDGATTKMFGQNFVDTIADGIFHIGFEIEDGRFLNEDGDANATVEDVADWINYFYSDQSTTGTGLDRIVDEIKQDVGLSRNTNAGDINDGADAADQLNGMIVDAIEETAADADGWITAEDLVAMNGYVRSDSELLAQFVELHGDDEDGVETGYHLVQNDGATTQYMGDNLVNTVADGIYHFGFEIENGRFVNEDGNANASIDDVSAWLNYFYGGKTIIFGTSGSDAITGTDDSEHILGEDGSDKIDAGGNDDLIYGGWGNDIIDGGDGSDIIYGQGGRDTLNGGDGSDVFRVAGNEAGGWESFQDFDVYADTGATGTDTIAAVGGGNVDIGLKSFGSASGIEVIDASGAAGTVRLLGDWNSNTLDFRGVTFVGSNIVIDGGYGADTIYGNAEGNTIIGGGDTDTMDGGEGGDTYVVTGNEAGGWESFQYYDVYADTGATGTDTIAAVGGGNVDIGLKSFGPASGIEVIDASGAAGAVRLLGDWNSNTLDFRGVTFVGSNIVIDGAGGNDVIFGNADANRIIGNNGSDIVDAGAGNDTIAGGDGNDTLKGGEGDDVLTGDSGTDTAVFSGSWSEYTITLDPVSNTFQIVDNIAGRDGADTVSLIERFQFADGVRTASALIALKVTGTSSAETLNGGDADDTIYGLEGDDTLNGALGSDYLDGGAGNDNMVGGTGNDTYVVDAADVVTEGSNAGTDTVLALRASYTLSANVENLSFIGMGAFVGTGNGLANTIRGGDGNDMLNGAAGADVLVGGKGNDVYIVDNANDAVVEKDDEGADTIQSTVTIGVLAGNVENLVLGGSSGISGTGNSLDNAITGNSAANVLNGLDGNDTLIGLGASDTMDGGAGSDLLVGGAGRDILTGGLDADVFDFNISTESGNSAASRDLILDFVHLEDIIDLADIDATSSIAGNDSFEWIGAAAFTNSSAGQVRYQYDAVANQTVIYADTDSDIASEFQIALAGNIALTASDFLL